MLADADGNPIYPLIYVLQSPDVMSERRDAFFERLIGTYGQRMAPGIPLPTLAQLERTYRFVDLSDFSTRTVIAEICNAPRGSAVIIGNANLFRSTDVPPRPEPARMPEDLWVPQDRKRTRLNSSH